jgi:hypothetical protein
VVQTEFAAQAVFSWGSPITTTHKNGIDFAEFEGFCQGVRISGVKVSRDVIEKSGGFVDIYWYGFVFCTQVSAERLGNLPWGVYRRSIVSFILADCEPPMSIQSSYQDILGATDFGGSAVLVSRSNTNGVTGPYAATWAQVFVCGVLVRTYFGRRLGQFW